jgi:hypothetical protein
MLHMSLRGLCVMVLGMSMMGVSEMRMVTGCFVIPIVVMFRSLAMMLGRHLMVLCGLSMVVGGLFRVLHGDLAVVLMHPPDACKRDQ